ncbi:hypothetical protein [Deinococcus sp.]|uniref:hypothetical protein n=1 Tax=Deinococcus sp. TaxID=47478 RepID=UPI0025C1C77A|nr:hypothetical protein [Deinococcus sp.]
MATLRRWGVQLHQVGTQVSATHPCDATSPVVGTAIWVNRPFLSGVALCGVSTAFEDWAFDQRERLALQVHNALLVNPATQPPCR